MVVPVTRENFGDVGSQKAFLLTGKKANKRDGGDVQFFHLTDELILDSVPILLPYSAGGSVNFVFTNFRKICILQLQMDDGDKFYPLILEATS